MMLDYGQRLFLKILKVFGRRTEYCWREMTGQKMAEFWQKINDKESRSVRYSMVPRKLMNLMEHDIAVMANWIERAGYGADLKALKVLANELVITMISLSSWLMNKTSIRNTQQGLQDIEFKKRFVPAS